jgi:hypothetical protein
MRSVLRYPNLGGNTDFERHLYVARDAFTLHAATIDAMGRQTETAAKADYVLALKSNHPKLYKNVIASFDDASMQNMRGTPGDYVEDAGKGHGRLETK